MRDYAVFVLALLVMAAIVLLYPIWALRRPLAKALKRLGLNFNYDLN